jgi:DNA-binding MarR family transcriptional regulator
MADVIPEVCSCSALRQAARHVTRFYDEALSPAGLGLNQYSILSKLNRFGPKTVQDLAQLLVMDRSTLGHLIKPLEAKGLIEMGASKTDKRQRVISLTASGVDLMKQAKPLWAKAEKRFERAFGADNAMSLRIALKQVTATEFGRL